jgi:hypothetical protein
MVQCKDCKKSEVGKNGRVCYIKAIHYQDIHVKDDDSCKYGVEKPVEVNKGTSQPVTPKVEEKGPVDTKADDKQETKANNIADNSKDVNKSNVSAKVN